MTRVEAMRDAIESKLESAIGAARDASDLEHLANALRAASEAEKLELERDNLRRGVRTENVRFWIPAIAPSVGAAALVLTLLFQIHQLNVNSQLQRSAEEGTELRDVIKAAQLPLWMSPIATTTRLRSFLSPNSPREQEARDLAVVFLGSTTDPEAFGFLFKALVNTTDRNLRNFGDLVRLSSILDAAWLSADAQRKSMEKAETDAQHAGLAGAVRSQFEGLSPMANQFAAAPPPTIAAEGPPPPMRKEDIQKIEDLYAREINQVGESMARLMRRAGRVTAKLDLTDAVFSYNHLSGTDLSEANLTDAAIDNSNVSDADFGGVSDWSESDWTGTAWWHARRISPGMLAYLKQRFPFDAKVVYMDGATHEEYMQQLARLEAAR